MFVLPLTHETRAEKDPRPVCILYSTDMEPDPDVYKSYLVNPDITHRLQTVHNP